MHGFSTDTLHKLQLRPEQLWNIDDKKENPLPCIPESEKEKINLYYENIKKIVKLKGS